jgi:hypothetical protein
VTVLVCPLFPCLFTLSLFPLFVGSLHLFAQATQKSRSLLVDHTTALDAVDESIVLVHGAFLQDFVGLGLANHLIDAFSQFGIFLLEGLKRIFQSMGEALFALSALFGMHAISFTETYHKTEKEDG